MKAFVIFRDRQAYAQRCTAAMAEAGLDPVIVDQGSTWPAALDWLETLSALGVPVLRRGGGHPRGLWDWPVFRGVCGTSSRYVVSDCDTVPSDCCPANWLDHLGELLDNHPEVTKAGLGLRTDDIPMHYQRRDQVISWESQFITGPVHAGDGAYRAGIDTTLALYRPLGEVHGFTLDNARNLRTGYPYLADHLAWHENLDDLPEEIQWYYEHAEPGITHWATRGRSTFGN